MRFSAIAVLATVASLASAVEYPFEANGPCITKCLLDIGKSMFPEFTDDPNDPNFFKSLYYAHERTTPEYKQYLATTNDCNVLCPKAEIEIYMGQYTPKNDWYHANKPGGSPNATATTTSGSSNPHGSKPTETSTSDAAIVASGMVSAAAVVLSAVVLF
ncbi:hypothetical protein BG011_006099 [Mortierella polycephala]|uniref:Uncharacterized protein n=1 Tax=Mortierella polycephala TaxID=41804 RepID=A0A9P6PTQ1_9FUNG|nr:hypothetical protein BG011_006099 [Mortierella polycephala]